MIAYLNPGNRWRNLVSVALVEVQRIANCYTNIEQRSYLWDQVYPLHEVHALVRGHWGSENRVYWVLDVIFYEDTSRIQTGYAPQHTGVVRHIACNLLRQEPGKVSVKTKSFRTDINDAYLKRVLGMYNAIALASGHQSLVRTKVAWYTHHIMQTSAL